MHEEASIRLASLHKRALQLRGDAQLLRQFLWPPKCDTLSDVMVVSPLGVSVCSPQKEALCRTTTSMPTVM